MRSPLGPSSAIREMLCVSVRPRCRYGPTVCEGVGVSSMVIFFGLQMALLRARAARCRNDNPVPTQTWLFPDRTSRPNVAAPFRPESIAEWDRKQRADRRENTFG